MRTDEATNHSEQTDPGRVKMNRISTKKNWQFSSEHFLKY